MFVISKIMNKSCLKHGKERMNTLQTLGDIASILPRELRERTWQPPQTFIELVIVSILGRMFLGMGKTYLSKRGGIVLYPCTVLVYWYPRIRIVRLMPRVQSTQYLDKPSPNPQLYTTKRSSRAFEIGIMGHMILHR